MLPGHEHAADDLRPFAGLAGSRFEAGAGVFVYPFARSRAKTFGDHPALSSRGEARRALREGWISTRGVIGAPEGTRP